MPRVHHHLYLSLAAVAILFRVWYIVLLKLFNREYLLYKIQKDRMRNSRNRNEKRRGCEDVGFHIVSRLIVFCDIVTTLRDCDI